MKPELIVVANAVEARLYTRESVRDPLLPLDAPHAPAGRRRPHELGAAPLGHERSERRAEGIAYTPRIDAQRKRHVQFAHRLAQRIDAALAGGRYGSVSLFAACPFIGELKGELSRGAKKSLRAAVSVDLTHFGPGELERRVAHELQAQAAVE